MSLEYARLQRENEELRKIIAAAKEALDVIEVIKEEDGQVQEDHSAGGLSLECRDCLSGIVYLYFCTYRQ